MSRRRQSRTKKVKNPKIEDINAKLSSAKEEVKKSNVIFEDFNERTKVLEKQHDKLKKDIKTKKASLKKIEKDFGEKEQSLSKLLDVKTKMKIDVETLEINKKELIDNLEKESKEKLSNAEKNIKREEKKLEALLDKQEKAKKATKKEKEALRAVSSHSKTVQATIISKEKIIASMDKKIEAKKKEIKEFSYIEERTHIDIGKKEKRLYELNLSLEEEAKENKRIKEERDILLKESENEKAKLEDTTEKLLNLIKREERVNRLIPEINEICKKIGYNPNLT